MRYHTSVRLEPVHHPRLWLTIALACNAFVLAAVFWDSYFEPGPPILVWGFVIPVAAAGAWSSFVLGRSCGRAKRIRLGHCPCCDYDLRATPNRCPECGTVADPSAAAALFRPKGEE